MKNMKFWRTALVATLVLTVMLSVTGGTIAWFTDEVTSANNVIKSGTLDLEVYYSNNDANWKDLEQAVEPLFNYNLWEPGYVMTKGVKLVNAGDLAFKFKLLFQPSAVSTDEYKLEDVIDVYVSENAVADRKNLGQYVGTLSSLMNSEDADGAVHGELYPKDKGISEDVVYVSLKMQETAGNDYQNLSVGNGFGLSIEAAQLMFEEDSFGNEYDKDAAYGNDVWNGEAGKPEDVPAADENNVITISTAEELAGFAAAVKAGNNYSGKTVKLDANIDLNNNAWTPIGDCESGKYFQGTFDGQGHTISGLNVDKSDDEYKYSTAGFFGWIDAATATIKNVNFDGATVKGSHWVGVVAGYMTGEISNCHVTNSTVTGYNVNDDANGDKVGGIVGYMNTGAGKLDGNSVKNSTISGNRDVAGLAGAVATTNAVSNNLVKNVTVKYMLDKDGNVGAAEIVSPRTGFTVNDTNKAENVKVIKCDSNGLHKEGEDGEHRTYYLYDVNDLVKFAELCADNQIVTGEGQGVTIELMGDVDLAGRDWQSINTMWVNFDGNSHTISNLTASGWKAGLFGYLGGGYVKDVTLHNVNVTGAQVGVVAGAYEGAGIENVKITGANVVNYAPHKTESYEETWEAVGAVVGCHSTGKVEVEIESGATITVNTNNYDTYAVLVNKYIGGGNNNNVNITDYGTVTVTGTPTHIE